jgi:polyisoprenoid-binding protein YceI
MKTFLTFLAATALGFSAWAGGPAATAKAGGPKAPSTYKVIPEASNIVWLAKKVTGEHTGTIKFASGTVEANGPVLTGGTFLVDMTTMVNTDLKDAEYNGKLMGHLKSPDFFDVASH